MHIKTVNDRCKDTHSDTPEIDRYEQICIYRMILTEAPLYQLYNIETAVQSLVFLEQIPLAGPVSTSHSNSPEVCAFHSGHSQN